MLKVVGYCWSSNHNCCIFKLKECGSSIGENVILILGVFQPLTLENKISKHGKDHSEQGMFIFSVYDLHKMPSAAIKQKFVSKLFRKQF